MSSKPKNPEIDTTTLGLADLDFFINDRVVPIVNDFDVFEKLAKKQAIFVLAELLEAFSWIHLGTQMGHFPLGPARRAIYEFFPPILKAHQLISKMPFFETAFGSPLRNIWDRELSGNLGLFGTGRLWEEDSAVPNGGASIFRNAYVYANEFVRDEETRPFAQGLTLAQDEEWQKAISKNMPVSDVEAVKVSGEPHGDEDGGGREFSGDAHWATAGVLSTVDYLRTVSQASMSDEMIPEKNIVALRQRIREIQQWRLNFADKSFRDRFQLAAETVAKQVKAADGVDRTKTFVDEVYQLMIDWGAPLKHMTAGNSAA
jgi:hypothetical protein